MWIVNKMENIVLQRSL